jgi:hypothetical protein
MTPRLVSVAVVAKHYGVHPRTILRAIEAGYFSPECVTRTPGGHWRFVAEIVLVEDENKVGQTGQTGHPAD